jgi:hypothetical protein
MERKAKTALSKCRTVTGDIDRRIKWVDPQLLTEAEQASLYRELYAQHREWLERNVESVIQWKTKNAERHKQKAKEYYEKNKEKLRAYGKQYRETKKATS